MKIAPLLLLTCCAMTAPSWAEDAPQTKRAANDGNACTWFSSIDDWHRLDDRNLIVWASRHEAYHVQLTMPLFDLGSAPSIGFVDHNRDGRLCGFGMDEIVVPRSPVFNSSTIASMTRLDDAGVAALAEKYKVKLRLADKKEKKTGDQAAQKDSKG